jgi:7,8-dihydropterin-6-yl-methyl-4-(beta-D-ribofuranosyl)aminobenzene 5'-phosphate synthase
MTRSSVWLLLLAAGAYAQSAVHYELRYAAAGDSAVSIQITLPQPAKAPAALVIARNYPGGYQQVPYDSFVEGVTGLAPDGKSLAVAKDADGPRWALGKKGESVQRIAYRVDIARMEAQIHDAVSSSKVRPGYAGLLGYSVFGYVDGLADRKIELRVDGPSGWPVLTTLASATAADFDTLADSEILMGPELKVSKLAGKIPLVMAIYAEGPVDAALEAQLARSALDRVQAYFGDTPFPQYTVQLELLKPLPGHDYNFSQEHVDSGTFSLSVDFALSAQSSERDRTRAQFNFAHHMAHCWIPKRAYGAGYKPFTWEMTPVIDTIWFNEGFGRYAAIAATVDAMPAADGKAFRDRHLAGLRGIVDSAPPFLRRMPLEVLSREASFLYAQDFRTGMNVFSRGALMAAEMDDRIREKTDGAKSLRDALRWLLRWSAEDQRPFQPEDLPRYFAIATGVDTSDILARWMQPLDAPQSQVKHLKVTILSTMLADEGIGEWGFAALVEADGQKILVDTGARPQTVLENARELKIDLSQVRDVVLTHFHSDHVGGLMTLRNEMRPRNPAALSRVHVATGIFYSRPEADGSEGNPMIAIKPQYEATGGQFIEHDSLAEILPGVFLTGPIPRPYPERNWSGSGKVRTPAGLVEDTVPDDQSMVVSTTGGLVVITGCGHAGIVNILTAVGVHFDRRTVLAVVGGLHLFAAKDEQVDWTGDMMKTFGVRYLLGAHCTGIESLYRLRSRLGLTRESAVVGAVGADFTLGEGIHPLRVAR